MLTLIYFILILGLIVLVHEFGHFIFSKIFGVYVHEFSIGMGPLIFSHKGKNKETMYSIRLIPIGGYCALAGEDDDMDKKIPKNRCLQAKPAWQRFLIMLFGPVNNFILAFVILFLFSSIWGAPSLKPVFTGVTEGYPAYEAGIEAGDVVLKVNDSKVSTTDDLAIYIQLASSKGPIEFTVLKKDGTEKVYEVTPKQEETDGTKVYRIGVSTNAEIKHDLGSIISYSFEKMGSLIKQMFITFGALFTGKLGFGDLSGPVGIYRVVGTQASNGIQNILYLIALLSVNVGFLNLMPIPAMDGGRIFLLLIEKLKGSPVKPETENLINTVGFILLIILMICVTISDVIKLF